MDYVDWVQSVWDGFVEAWKLPKNRYPKSPKDTTFDEFAKAAATGSVEGLMLEQVGKAMGFSDDDLAEEGECKPVAAIGRALDDLAELGIVERDDAYSRVTIYPLPQKGREIAKAGLPSIWDKLVDVFLADEQRQVLEKLTEMCQENKGAYVCLHGKLLTDVAKALGQGWDEGQVSDIVKDLEQASLVRVVSTGYIIRKDKEPGLGRAISTGDISVGRSIYPTYGGIVRVTRQVDTEWRSTIRGLLEDWETTNVDFKQEVNLKTPAEKAEFVKDILALVTTKSSGRRFMVIGFDNNTHEFVKSVDPGITQDRIEDILNSYTSPVPIVKYVKVNWKGNISGEVGVVEMFREPHKLPSRVKADMSAKILKDDVFVRHGSHTAKLMLGEEELQDLIDEGNKAKQYGANQ